MPTTPFLTVGAAWPRLEPAQNPNQARTRHVKLAPNTTFVAGEAIVPKDDGTEVYARIGTAGYGAAGKALLLEYPSVVDATGNARLGTAADIRPNSPSFDTVPAYHQGDFFVADTTGITDDATLARVGELIQGVAYNSANAMIRL